MKHVICLSSIGATLFIATVLGSSPQPPLTNKMLADLDGTPWIGASKIRDTLWLMTEIKNIHQGIIKTNSAGEIDVHNGRHIPITFKNQKITLKELVEIEAKISTFPSAEQKEFEVLFQKVKLYFALVNETMLAEARGAFLLMKDLIQEFCEKRNRHDSILLNWENGREVELYKTSITSFKILYTVSIDLLNFLAAFVQSCPKAKALHEASMKRRATQNT
jgi:hypothetical protein